MHARMMRTCIPGMLSFASIQVTDNYYDHDVNDVQVGIKGTLGMRSRSELGHQVYQVHLVPSPLPVPHPHIAAVVAVAPPPHRLPPPPLLQAGKKGMNMMYNMLRDGTSLPTLTRAYRPAVIAIRQA